MRDWEVSSNLWHSYHNDCFVRLVLHSVFEINLGVEVMRENGACDKVIVRNCSTCKSSNETKNLP